MQNKKKKQKKKNLGTFIRICVLQKRHLQVNEWMFVLSNTLFHKTDVMFTCNWALKIACYHFVISLIIYS